MISHRVTLAYRHHGVHNTVRSCIVTHTSSLLYQGTVREEILVGLLPSDFLGRDPEQNPEHILLLIGNEAVGEPTKFRAWGKYFDAYSLTIEPGHKT